MESSVLCIRRQLAVCQPTVGHLLSFVGRLLAGCRPAIYRQSAVCQQLFTDSQPTDLQGNCSSIFSDVLGCVAKILKSLT